MELTMITVEKILEMVVTLLIGVLLFRTGMLDSASNKKLSGVLLKLVTPAMIFMSYQIDFENRLLEGLVMTLILTTASVLLSLFLAMVLFRNGSSENVEIERMSVVYTNCGYIGLPLAQGLLGQEGVFYISAYMTIFNVFVWSHGIAQMSGTTDIKKALKNLVQPAMIAILAGVLCFLAQIRLPEVLANPLRSVGNMNTPLAMIVAGSTLAESNLLQALKRPRVYWINFLKLFVVPLATLFLLAVVPVSRDVGLIVLVGAACPTGAIVTMLALQYDKDSNYASELFTISTVLSMITIPVMVFLANWLL